MLHQTVTAAQLVLSDDASTDGTVEAVREVVARFRAERPSLPLVFTVLENPEPLGVTANFEQAVRACTGDLVALCDQDDLWAPNRLEVVTALFAADPRLLLLHGDARLVDAGGEPLGETLFDGIGFGATEQREVREGRAFDTLLRRNVVTGATTVFRRELLERALPFPASWVHDEWLAMVAAIFGRVDFVPEALVDYRQHGGNQIGAGAPSLAELFGRLREPRAVRNARLLARAEALLARLEARDDVSPDVVEAAAGKLRHERVRSALPGPRPLRIVPVLREALTGRYSRFGRARYDVVRDLVQPVDRG